MHPLLHAAPCPAGATMLPSGACRAAVHLKLRNNDQAMKDADLACKLDSHYAKAYLRRAAAHTALEQFEEAVRDYEKVTALWQLRACMNASCPHPPSANYCDLRKM